MATQRPKHARDFRRPSVPGRVAPVVLSEPDGEQGTRPQVVKLTHSRPGSTRLGADTASPRSPSPAKEGVLGVRLGPARGL